MLVQCSCSGCQFIIWVLVFMLYVIVLFDMYVWVLEVLYGNCECVGVSINIGIYFFQLFVCNYLMIVNERGEVDLCIVVNLDVVDQLLVGQFDVVIMEWWLFYFDFEYCFWWVELLVFIVSFDYVLVEVGCIECDCLVDLLMLGGELGSGIGWFLIEYFGELGVFCSGMQLGSIEVVK